MLNDIYKLNINITLYYFIVVENVSRSIEVLVEEYV